MPPFSHSRIETFKQCARKYSFAYIERPETERGKSVEAFMGSRVHAALEKLYKDLKFGKLNELKELLEFYKNDWDKSWTGDIHMVRPDYTPQNFLSMGERFLTDYFNRFRPFDQSRTIGLETQDRVAVDGAGDYMMHVKIDRLALGPDGSYEIHDYKTGNRLPKQEEIDADRQLAIYAYGVKKLYPDAERIRLFWHYLAFDKTLESERSDDELDRLRSEVMDDIRMIESAADFPTKVSALCEWCEFQPLCPAWKHRFETEALSPQEFQKEDGVMLVNRFARLLEESRKKEKDLESVKSALARYAEEQGVSMVFGSDKKASVKTYQSLSFPKKDSLGRKEFEQALRKIGLWDAIASPDHYELAKMLNRGQVPEDKAEELERFITRGKKLAIYLSGK